MTSCGPFQSMCVNGLGDPAACAKVICAAFAASRAAYEGLVEFSAAATNTRPVTLHDSVWVMTEDGSSEQFAGYVAEVREDTQEAIVVRAGQAGARDVAEGEPNRSVEAVGLWRLKHWTAPGRNATMHVLNDMDTCAEEVMWSYEPGGSQGQGESTCAAAAVSPSMQSHIVVKACFDSDRNPNHKTLIVACRGSVTADDWATDFSPTLATDRPDSEWESQVHSGFLQRCETIPIEPFLAHLRAGGSLLFTGHSLGSAVAELLCIKVLMHVVIREKDILKSIRLQDHLAFVGFASPVVGTLALGSKLRNPEIGGPVYHNIFHHFQTPCDIVPIMTNLRAVRQTAEFAVVKDALYAVVDAAMTVIVPAQFQVLKSFANTLIVGKTWTEVVSFTGKKIPSLSKSYGRWYHLQADRTFETFVLKDDASIEAMVAKDMLALTNASGDTLAQRISHHYISAYESMLPAWALTKRSPLDTRSLVRASYIFPVTEDSLIKPSTVYYSAAARTLKVSIASEGSSSAAVGLSSGRCGTASSRALDYSRCRLFVKSETDVLVDSVCAIDPMSCKVVTAEPHEIVLHFPAALDLTPNLQAALTLEGTYVLESGHPQVLVIPGLRVEAAVDDAQVVDNLRRGLFLALSDTVDSARRSYDGGTPSAFAALARCQLQELERVASRRVEFELPAPGVVVWLRSPDLEQEITLSCLPTAQFGCRLHLVHGDSCGYRISRESVPSVKGSALEYLCVGNGVTSCGQLKTAFSSAVNSALIFKLSLARGSSDERPFSWVLTTRFQGMSCTLNSTNYFSVFWANELALRQPDSPCAILPVNLAGRTSGTLYPVLHGPLTECAQLLVLAYLNDQCQGERTVRRSMIDNSAKYLADLETVRPQEFAAVKTWRRCSEELPNISNTVLQESASPMILCSDQWGLPPALPLCDVFAKWRAACQHLRTLSETELRVAAPPITRFFFAALPLLFDVAMTVCAAVSRKLVEAETNWLQRLFGYKDVTTTLAKEYHARVLYVCSKIRGKGDEFQELRQATLVDGKRGNTSGGGEASDDLLQRNSLGKLERMLTAFHSEKPQCVKNMTEFKKMMWDQSMPDSTVKALHFVYQLVLRVAILGKHVCHRIHVAAVFGPQKTGKTTLLECLLGDDSLNRFNDLNGNTKEPIVVKCATPGAQLVHECPECGQEHIDFTSLLPCHLIYDLPGYTDQSPLGSMIRSLQMLVLGCARVLLVIQPIDMQQNNSQRYELLCNVPSSARAVVLLARSNVLFTEIRNMWAQDGIPTPLLLQSVSREPARQREGRLRDDGSDEDELTSYPSGDPSPQHTSIVFEWYGEWYAAEKEHLDDLCGSKLFAVTDPAAPETLLLQQHRDGGGSLPVTVVTAHLVKNMATPFASIGEVGKVFLSMPAAVAQSDDEELTRALREALTQPQDMSLEAAIDVISDHLAEANIDTPSRAQVQVIARRLQTNGISSRWVLLDLVVAARKGSGNSPANAARKAASSPSGMHYSVANKIWNLVLQRANQARAEILPKLKDIMEITADSFQLYIPRTGTGTNFYSDFESEPHPLLDRSLALQVQVRENSSIVQNALQKIGYRCLIPVRVQSVPSPEDKVTALFRRVSLDSVLDQEDVRAFIATYDGGLGRCNKELLECLGLRTALHH